MDEAERKIRERRAMLKRWRANCERPGMVCDEKTRKAKEAFMHKPYGKEKKDD